MLSVVMSVTTVQPNRRAIDDALSKRSLALDPGGYFIIYLDRDAQAICAKHFSNVIDDRGLAVDPATGKPIPARGAAPRAAETLFCGSTAKELCVKIFEQDEVCPVTLMDHAAYLGREFTRAEAALDSGEEYIQD